MADGRRFRPSWAILAAVAILTSAGPLSSFAAEQPKPAAAAAETQPDEPLSDDELEQLVARIALYPDELVAAICEAALVPVQIVEAERFLEKRTKDPTLKPKDT